MKIFAWDDVINGNLASFIGNRKTSLTIGSFDGPHIGHRVIFDSVLDSKNQINTIDNLCGVVTFTRSLTGIKQAEKYKGDISTIDEKLDFFENYRFDFCIVVEFSPDFREITGEKFFEILKNNCHLSFLAEGRDFKCGYKGSYDIDCIKLFCEKNDITLHIVSDLLFEGERISSSRIRLCIANKQFDKVQAMLGRKYKE